MASKITTHSNFSVRLCLNWGVLDRITAAFGAFSLAKVCRAFRDSVQRVLQGEWATFPLQNYPHIQNIARRLGVPRDVAGIESYYNAALDMVRNFRGTDDYVQRLTAFSPARVAVSLESALQRAENDSNLMKIGRRICQAIAEATGRSLVGASSAAVMRSYLLGAAMFRRIEELDLSNLGLTAIPEELAAWLPQLRSLDLSNNQLTSLPDTFLSNAPQLQSLNLSGNRISSLPPGFGNAWPWWLANRNRSLQDNPIILQLLQPSNRQQLRALMRKHCL